MQLIQIIDLMIPEKKQRLGHLLQIINRGPAGIGGSLVLHFALDIDQQIYRFLRTLTLLSLTFLLVFSEQPSTDIGFRVTFAQGRHSHVAFLRFPFQRNMSHLFDHISGLHHHFQKRRKVFRIFCENCIDVFTDDTADRFFLRIQRPLYSFSIWLWRDYGKSVLQADQVTYFLYCSSGAQEETEPLRPVHAHGIEHDMVMDVRPVRVRRHDKGIPPFRKPQSCLPAQPVRFFRRDLAGFERLADLISDDAVLSRAPCEMLELTFLQHEFFVDSDWVTAVGGHEFAFFRLFRIHRIVRSGTEALCHGTAFVRMQRDKSCCSHRSLLYLRKPRDYFFCKFPKLVLP